MSSDQDLSGCFSNNSSDDQIEVKRVNFPRSAIKRFAFNTELRDLDTKQIESYYQEAKEFMDSLNTPNISNSMPSRDLIEPQPQAQSQCVLVEKKSKVYDDKEIQTDDSMLKDTHQAELAEFTEQQSTQQAMNMATSPHQPIYHNLEMASHTYQMVNQNYYYSNPFDLSHTYAPLVGYDPSVHDFYSVFYGQFYHMMSQIQANRVDSRYI